MKPVFKNEYNILTKNIRIQDRPRYVLNSTGFGRNINSICHPQNIFDVSPTLFYFNFYCPNLVN